MNALLKTRMTNRWLPFSFATLLAFSHLIAAAEIEGDDVMGNDYWSEPVFIKSFMGSYGVRSEIEPTISVEEKKVFESLIEQVDTDPATAIETLRAAITPESSAALDFTLANLLFQRGELEDAAGHYEKALTKFPAFMRALKNLGMTHFRLGESKKAVTSFTKAIELGGEDGSLYGLLGHAYLRMDRPLAAESSFRKAILFEPDYTAWVEGLASAMLHQRNFDSAAALFDELIAKDRDKAVYWLAQADAYLGAGESEKAASNYELLRRMDKATPASLMNLGDIYLNMGLPDRSLDTYRQTLDQAKPTDINRLLNRLAILSDQIEPEPVLALFQELRDKASGKLSEEDDLKLLRLQAKVLIRQGKTNEAIPTLERILERNPMDAGTLLLLGDHHADNRRIEEAELLYERAGRVKGFASTALVRRAQLQVKGGNYTSAIPLLRQAQVIAPKPNVASYLNQLERLVEERKQLRSER